MHLGELVARNARMIPTKEALVYGSRRYSWKEVDERSNAVANWLLGAGISRGHNVAMWLFNGDAFVFTFYGIVKAGAVAVPVNFRLAPPEAEYVFGHCEAAAVVFDDAFEPAIREMRPRLRGVRLLASAGAGRFEGSEPLAAVVDGGDVEDPEVAVDEDDPSEILYTSGTTGKPKGALLTHHSQMTVAATMMSLVGLRPDDRLLHAAPLFHSAELNLYMNPGTYLGCTQVVVRDFVPAKVLDAVEHEKVTQFFGAPVMYTMMMADPGFDQRDLSSVRFWGYGAAPMPAHAVRAMIDRFKTDRFFCLCGFTEAGPGGIALGPEDQVKKAGAGGKPIVNMESRLVDELGAPITRPGVVGELVVRGDTIMKEYYRDPEATRAAIRNGWVHSGDLAVLDDEGYVTLVDRKKDMIITGGENVYSKQVEDELAAHPKIADVAVVGVPHPDWGETVAAVVVPRKDQTITLEEVREFLAPRIAHYKIPRRLEIASMLPRNVSGKVLKYQLRAQLAGTAAS